jgi:hypothetical protein
VGKKKATPSVDELVSEALLKLATADGPRRLTGKGEPQALFASTGGAAKQAIERLRYETDPLVTAVGEGKSAPVRLTPAGFRRIVQQLPEESVGAAAKAIAAGLPIAERVEFLNEIIGRAPTAAPELLPVYEAAVAAEAAEAEARRAAAARRREREEASREALERWLRLTTQRKQQRIDALLTELAAEGWRAPAGPAPPATAQPHPRPQSREDASFRREVAGRLVSAWLESYRLNKPEGRLFLETAMGNVSVLRQIGEEGERLPYDGKYHEADSPVPAGGPVRVVRPGWVLEEEDGEYRLVAAKVSP